MITLSHQQNLILLLAAIIFDLLDFDSYFWQDPIESLMVSAEEVQRACAQALLVDRGALAGHQDGNDALAALGELKRAFVTDVRPVLAEARARRGGALDPVACYRASGYRAEKARERPQEAVAGSGIV